MPLYKTDEIISKIVAQKSESLVIKVSSTGYLPFGGQENGLIVTQDKKMYKYEEHFISRVTEDDYIEEKNLNEIEFNKILDFVNSELISKDIEEPLFKICDASYRVEVNYNGINKKIRDEIELYENVEKFLKEIWENSESEVESIKHPLVEMD